MRTTVTLDGDVARLLEEAVHRLRRPFKHVLNDAIRRGLSSTKATPASRYVAPVFHARLNPGFDPRRMNELADELELEASLERARPRRASRKSA